MADSPKSHMRGGHTVAAAKHEDVSAADVSSEAALLAEKQHSLKGRLTLRLVLTTLVVAFGSSLSIGYHTGVLNIPEELITEWIGEVNLTRVTNVTEANLPAQLGMVNSLLPVGCIIGSLLASWMGERLGRRGGLLANSLLAISAALLMSTSKSAKSIWPMLTGRIVAGVNVGISSVLAPMYLSEISPTNYRGLIVGTNGIAGVFGLLIGQIAGLPQLLGTADLWPILFVLPVIPAVFQLFLLPFCPESPIFLLFGRQNRAAAESAMWKLRSDADLAAKEILLMWNGRKKDDSEVTWARLFQSPLNWLLLVAVTLMFAQQFSGINAVIYYSTNIFVSANMTAAQAQYATLGVGVVSLVTTVISAALIELIGRRVLLLSSLSGMLLSTIGLVAFMKVPPVAVLSVMLFVGFFSLGAGPIPFLYANELFDPSARPKAASLACLANWMAMGTVTFSYKYVQMALGDWNFLIFTASLAVFIFFVWKFVPESKNKSVEEVQEEAERLKSALNPCKCSQLPIFIY